MIQNTVLYLKNNVTLVFYYFTKVTVRSPKDVVVRYLETALKKMRKTLFSALVCRITKPSRCKIVSEIKST